MRILLLEDDFTDADLTRRGLMSNIQDCSVDIASTIKQSREMLFPQSPFNIAILDMKLPDGNGLDLLLEIRQSELKIPVIMLTGSGDDETAVAALKAGADDYIVKRLGYADKLSGIVDSAIKNFKENLEHKSEVIDVLYIEHHLTDIDLTIRHLRQYAPYINVDAVRTEKDAISKLFNDAGKPLKYKVILIDYHMPGMNTLELIKTIRREHEMCIPIILVTGQGNEDIAVQALKVGVNEYLTKSEKYLYRLPSLILNAYQNCELKKKQVALAESESKYRLLAENSGDVIFVMDLDLKYSYISPAVKSLRGFEPEEAINQNISEVLTPDSYKKAVDVIGSIFPSIKDSTISPTHEMLIELEMIRKDKTTVWTEVKASLITDRNNNPVGILGVSRDISERKFAMDELRKLSRAIEQSPASVIITDTEGAIEYVNPKFTLLTGYTLPEVKGKTPRILKSGHMNRSDYKILWETIKSGEEWRGEFHNRRKDGSLYWEQASISPIKDNDGKISHFLAVKEDITEKKKIVDELIIAKDKAEESTRLKSAFLANISHEIRTPLNGIMGFADLLQTPDLTGEEQEMYFGILRESGDRMLNTINDIIEMSKIEAGHTALNNASVDVNDLMNYFYNFFRPEAESKGLSLKLSNSHKAKAVNIYTDKNKVESILGNLLKNAIKFTQVGFVEFGIKTEKGILVFYVKDSGIGIPADKLEAIFHRFVQADLAISRSYEGAGLGLSIAKSYAELLGGKISVESEEGVGSTFSFIMPYHHSEPETDVFSSDTSVQAPFSRGELILIVEDDRVNYHYLEQILKNSDFKLLHVTTGEESVKICRDNPDISLVLMDIKLPVLNGFEATKQIREFRPDLPVIAQTAYAQDLDKEKALACGCSDYISKPYKKEDLLSKIRKQLYKT